MRDFFGGPDGRRWYLKASSRQAGNSLMGFPPEISWGFQIMLIRKAGLEMMRLIPAPADGLSGPQPVQASRIVYFREADRFFF